MLSSILEIYIVWHPNDSQGKVIADEFVEHFHGTSFSGLIGGAVEVFTRSVGWDSDLDSPRPIPSVDTSSPGGLEPAKFTVIVPLIGNQMLIASNTDDAPWLKYIKNILTLQNNNPQTVGIFPYKLDSSDVAKSKIADLLKFQQIAQAAATPSSEPRRSVRCRDLAQGITQLLSPEVERLTIFISHTKHTQENDSKNISALIENIRQIISNTKLGAFFDTNDLQPGREWEEELREKASKSAMLALRTDLYPSREWCQSEILIAKTNGMPIVTVDAIDQGEERGSFLMDHVPRLPIRNGDIHAALNLLVDECLKRALWKHQQAETIGRDELNIAWWAPHAPEAITLLDWLTKIPNDLGNQLRILHPDPPLSKTELLVLTQIIQLKSNTTELDIMTPRILATRGG